MKRLLLLCSLGLFVGQSNAQTALDLDGAGNKATVSISPLSEFTIEYDFLNLLPPSLFSS